MAENGDEEPVGLDAEGTMDKERLSDPVIQKDRKIEELTDTLKRLQAEFENYKKRVAKEWTDRSRLASEGVVYDLLAILDTFDTALGSDNARSKPDANWDGLDGIHRQLLQALQRHGLKEIRTDGKFDPFEHEAIMRQETDDCEEGTILEVFQKGYLLGPKVIRTAKVKVSKKTQAQDDHDARDDEDSQDIEREVSEE
jgi:molecular chaperone GrpE